MPIPLALYSIICMKHGKVNDRGVMLMIHVVTYYSC